MANPYHITITTVGKEIFNGSVEMTMLPGETGVFGVLKDHENTFAYLKRGDMTLISGEENTVFRISEGIALIDRNEAGEFQVKIVVDEIQPVHTEGINIRREIER